MTDGGMIHPCTAGRDSRHNCLVVYKRRFRDLWCKSFWVVCIYCDQMAGPHPSKDAAWKAADAINDEADRQLDALMDAQKGKS